MYSCIVVVQGPTKNIFGSVVSGTVFKEIADKVYAHEFSKENTYVKNQTKFYPFSRPGDKAAFEIAAKSMKIPIEDNTKGTPLWISTRTGKEAINISNQKMIKGLVPNVKGMGLIDAAFLLEQCGLYVLPVGSGIVKQQSILPGKKDRERTTNHIAF